MHSWYDLLKDIALPSLTGGASVVVGVAAILVSNRSHRLAERVRVDELQREARAAREQYRGQFGHFIESAITSLVEYGNSVEKRSARLLPERQLHAATQARLMLVHATAQGEDKRATKAAYEVFHQLLHNERWNVRQSVAGRLAGALANTLAEQDSIDDIEAAIRDFIRLEEDDV